MIIGVSSMNIQSPVWAAFKLFDHTLGLVSEERPSTIDAMSHQLRRAVGVLPQRQFVLDANIAPWIDRVLYLASKRIEEGAETAGYASRMEATYSHACWHVRRLSGIGGSEAGSVLAHMSGRAPDFGDNCDEHTFESARNIVAGKLLIMAPSAPTRDMTRGVRAERHIRAMYHESRAVASAEGELAKWHGHRPPKAPWMIGTPDDFVVLPTGLRKLIDYKAPSADSFESFHKEVPFEYRAQLHHYGIVASSAGVAFDVMSLAVFSARDFEVVEFPVEISRKFATQLARAASAVWRQNVMAGRLPDIVEPENLTPDDPGVVRLGHRMTLMKMILEDVGKRQADLSKQLNAYFTHVSGNSTGRADFGVSTYSRTRKWDDSILVGMADAAGIDVARFLSGTDKPDPEMMASMLNSIKSRIEAGEPAAVAVQELLVNGVPMKAAFDKDACALALSAAGIDTNPAADVDTRFLISQKKRGPIAELVSGMRDAANEIVDALEQVGERNIECIMNGARRIPDDATAASEPSVAEAAI